VSQIHSNFIHEYIFVVKTNLFAEMWHKNKNMNETLSDDQRAQTINQLSDNYRNDDQVIDYFEWKNGCD